MAEMIKMPVLEPIARSRPGSAWAPLAEPLFRSLWIASVISYTGTWMQNVGAGWLMTQMTMNPLMVGLVQAAAALPVFLVILPAGALADMVDRRRFLLLTQGWMVLASATLGIMTLTSCVGPWVLLLVYLPARNGRGNERSGMAGDHPRTGSCEATCRRRVSKFGGIQRSAERSGLRSADWLSPPSVAAPHSC